MASDVMRVRPRWRFSAATRHGLAALPCCMWLTESCISSWRQPTPTRARSARQAQYEIVVATLRVTGNMRPRPAVSHLRLFVAQDASQRFRWR